jgi:hypothetical protein
MTIQEAIDKAVLEDIRVTFECPDDRETILGAIVDMKGCALIKPCKESTEITVWPPSQCSVHQDQGQTSILPKCLL